MAIFNTIKSKFIFNLVAAVGAVLVSVIVAYFIATSSIHNIMTNDLMSVADALEKNVNYIAKIEPNAYKKKTSKAVSKASKLAKAVTSTLLMLRES